METKFISNFQFLSPRLTIKNNHLTKEDVRKIKASLATKIGAMSSIIAAGFLIICILLLVSMGVSTGGQHIEVYGLTSLLGQVFGAAFCLVAVVLEVISFKTKEQSKKALLNRFTNLALYLALASTLFLSLYADAEMGYLSSSPTISVSIVLLAVLILIQPVYWLEAAILDMAVTGLVIAMAIYCNVTFATQSTLYYILIAVLFPLLSYLIISILFYAETQKYIQDIRNAILNDTAMYDELTHCKNRHALKSYLKDNSKRWSNEETNLLLIMFDIDNFKLYNDTFSHPGGDYCLVSIADALRRAFPLPDLNFFRYGGEEFLLFFELENPKEAKSILEKARKAVQNLNIEAPGGAPYKYVTISVGGTLIKTVDEFDFDKHLQIVDSYLYQAKANGKNICVIDGKAI